MTFWLLSGSWRQRVASGDDFDAGSWKRKVLLASDVEDFGDLPAET